MEELKKEVESLKRTTFHLRLTLIGLAISLCFITVNFTVRYCEISDYYQETITSARKMNQQLEEQNRLLGNYSSRIQDLLREKSEKYP